MCFEGMEGIPLLVDFPCEYNAEQLKTAENYYRKQGDEKSANFYHEAYLEEKRRIAEEDSLTWFDKLLKKIIK